MTHRPGCPRSGTETTISASVLAEGVPVYIDRCVDCGATALRTGRGAA